MAAPRLAAAPMSVDQAAAVLQVSRDTLVRFCDDRYTPADQQLRAEKTTGGEWQIKSADLAAFINRRSVTPAGETPIFVSTDVLPRIRSLREVAADTGLPLWWLQKRASAGEIPHIKAGRALRMTDEHADRAVQLRRASEILRDDLGGAAA